MKAYDPFKRLFDCIVGAVAGVISLPLQAIIAVLVGRSLGSPVLFRQQRPGKDEEVFELLKFRTMKDVDESQGLITDEDRLTKFGIFLRSTSLDELPSLWNVVKGDMSLVGPRPLLVEYLPRYSREQARRHEVRPGVTGLAQISGRNAITWEAKFSKDVEYVDNRSLLLDLKIIWGTITKVIRRDGISAEGEATMAKFEGSDHG